MEHQLFLVVGRCLKNSKEYCLQKRSNESAAKPVSSLRATNSRSNESSASRPRARERSARKSIQPRKLFDRLSKEKRFFLHIEMMFENSPLFFTFSKSSEIKSEGRKCRSYARFERVKRTRRWKKGSRRIRSSSSSSARTFIV